MTAKAPAWFTLTAWLEGRDDKPLYQAIVQADDETDALRQARLPLAVAAPVRWEAKCAWAGGDDATAVIDQAVRLLTEWTEAHDRGGLFDETSDFIRRVRP